MRVLHVTQTYYPDTRGGIEEVVRQIVLNTKSYGVETRIFTLTSDPVTKVVEIDGVKVFRALLTLKIASCGMSISAFKQFKNLVDWADIVHYHFPWPFADLLHISARVNKKTVITYHSDVVRQKRWLITYKTLMNSFLAQIDVIVATSDNYIESSNILQQYRHKVCTIPLGISKQSYPVPTEQKITEIENKVGKDFFLFVGTLRKYKNLHILLDVLKNITLQCVIVGSGPEEKALKHYAKKMQITNVKFTGRVSDIDKVAFIKLCRALVLPSNLRSEAFGVVLLEGAMYKKPLISTELGTGSSYVNIDGKTGIVVPPSNMDALQEAMLLLDRDEVLANKMGQAAFERYNELFTGEVMGEQYAELYEALLKESVDD